MAKHPNAPVAPPPDPPGHTPGPIYGLTEDVGVFSTVYEPKPEVRQEDMFAAPSARLGHFDQATFDPIGNASPWIQPVVPHVKPDPPGHRDPDTTADPNPHQDEFAGVLRQTRD